MPKKEKESDAPPPYSAVVMTPPTTRIDGIVEDPDLVLETSAGIIDKEHTILLKIQPTCGVARSPVHICCVVDISGSMSDIATFQNENGSRESDGLIILDLVKHAIRTILSTMTAVDMLSIVSFSNEARVELDPILMDSTGKQSALKILEALNTEGSTNLWGGLEMGLDTIRCNKASSNNTAVVESVFLFTDGQPNVIPPRGHMPMIRMYKDKHNLPASVNTFGFGYSLESALLDQIARECDGSYVFIPDSSFVGTAFINATANLYTVMAKNAVISLAPTVGLEVEVTGGHQVQETSWGKTIRVGNVRFDQNREIILVLKKVPTKKSADTLLTAFLDFTTITTQKEVKKEVIVLDTDFNAGNKDTVNEIQRHTLRYRFVDAVEKVQEDIKAGSKEYTRHVKFIKDTVTLTKSAPSDAFITALLEDVNGQVVEALTSEESYCKWGLHYLPSLADAHRSQVCNNFKDPGVQGYGGPLFNALRDNFDATFNTLPPPKPSRKGTRNAPVDMSLYNCSRGPCFHGDCLVQTGPVSEYRKVSEIQKGDLVMTHEGHQSKVLCVIKTIMEDGLAELVQFPGGLRITPYHPVYDSKSFSWKFPVDLHKSEYVSCDAVYSFVLEYEHNMLINGVACVTLGHGFTGDVREHAYFGTDLVLRDLKSSGGWEMGLVICKNLVRDSVTGLVCKMELVEHKMLGANCSRPKASNPIPIVA